MTQTHSIRPARPDDEQAVSALLARAYPRLLAPDYDPATLDRALPLITRARPELLACGTYFVAEDANGRVIGAGGWSDVSPTRGVYGPREGHVRHVATDPACTRRGVARALMQAVIASARTMGMYRLHCMSTLTARDFYRAMAFQPQSEIELTLAPGVYFPAIQMRRDL